MAIIPRTTRPLDAEINLPDVVPYPSLPAETAWYKEWQDSFVSENPVEAQIALFTKLAELVENDEVDVEFYRYWYGRVNLSHPVVFASLSANPIYPQVNENTGSLYYVGDNPANVANSALGVTPIFPFEGNLAHKLPAGVTQYITSAYTTVNEQYSDNIANVISASPTAAHGKDLVKDIIAVTRNDASKSLIQSELQSKYDKAFDLLEIAGSISGDVAISKDTFTTDVEGVTVTVDTLTNKVDPEIDPLSNTVLDAS